MSYIDATITVAKVMFPAKTELALIAGGDPYFLNVDSA
jgi:hypothetical protein